MFERYQPSGRFGFSGVAALVAGGVVAFGLAWPYQKIVDWVPLIYAEIFISLGFGVALGAIAAACLLFGRSRNPAMNGMGVVLIALAGWAGSFWWDRAFVHAKFYEEAKRLFASEKGSDDPRELISEEDSLAQFSFGEYVDVKTEAGWSIGRVGPTTGDGHGMPIKGVLVYLVWLAEAGMIGLFAWKHAKPRLDRPFCEPCGAFAAPRLLPQAVGVRPTPMREAADRADLAALTLPSTEKGSALVGEYRLHECPTCHDGGWLDVTTVLAVPGAKGKTKFVRTPVVRQIVLTKADRDAVVAARERKPEPVAPASPATPPAAAPTPAAKKPQHVPSDG